MRSIIGFSLFCLLTAIGNGLFCQEIPLVEKSFDSCRHCVYGRAEKRLAVGDTEDIDTGTVSLKQARPIRGIRFDKKSSSFVVHHSGTYVIDYFLKAFYDTGEAEYPASVLSIAVKINKKLKGVRNLFPIDLRGFGGAVYLRNSVIFERLRKGDRVRLVVIKKDPSGIEFRNYSVPDVEVPKDTVAYLAMHKIGKTG